MVGRQLQAITAVGRGGCHRTDIAPARFGEIPFSFHDVTGTRFRRPTQAQPAVRDGQFGFDRPGDYRQPLADPEITLVDRQLQAIAGGVRNGCRRADIAPILLAEIPLSFHDITIARFRRPTQA